VRAVFAVLGTVGCVLAMMFGALMNVHGGRSGPFVLVSTGAAIWAIWKTRGGTEPERFWMSVVLGPFLIVVVGMLGSY
jgi:hypothetical protein